MADKVTFNSLYPVLCDLVDKRKNRWKLLSILEWEDVRMIILERLFEKFELYNQEMPLENWANTLITHALMNLERQNLYRHARPCVAADPYGRACVFNQGGNLCAKTTSGKQCSECWIYAKWQKKKEAKFNVSTPLALENHIHESHSLPEDSVDVARAKEVIDEKIMEQLNKHEAKIYKLLYIENLSMEQVGIKMKYKKQNNSKIAGYQVLLKFSRKVKMMARQIIEDHELA